MNDITQIFEFMMEVEKLKGVLRKSKPVGLERYENSAEHSWHVCLSALMLKDYAKEPVDIDRVIRMLLIHDLGEIDAGDKIIYSSETPQQKSEELAGIQRLLQFLPSKEQDYFLTLWQEFELGESPEARFAKAIDRIPPLLHNIHHKGEGWSENGISKQQVFDLNSERISAGSPDIWKAMESKLIQAVEDGILK